MPDCSQESGKESSEECGKESGKDGANNRIEVSSKHFPCLHFPGQLPAGFFLPHHGGAVGANKDLVG